MEPEKDRASIKYIKAVADVLPEPILVIGEDLRLIAANDSFYKTFHAEPKDSERKIVYELGGGDWNISALRELLDKAKSQKELLESYEVKHEFPKAGERTLLLSVKKIDETDPEKMLIIITDVTERSESDRKLALSEVRYRKLFETAKDGILLIDPLTDKIIDANPFLLDMIGYTLEEVIDKKLWEIGAFKDIEATKKIFDELHKEGYVRYEDLPLQNKDGREIDVEFVSNLYAIDFSINMIQCNIRNITDRKIAENKARTYLAGLEKLNGFMTGRELKMVELKAEINKLKKELLAVK